MLHSAQKDVIICGGGPAGATAALVLARRGHTVTLYDKADFPRPKLCGGLLTWKSMQLLERVHGETADSLTDAGVINQVSDKYVIRTLDQSLAQGTLTYPFHLVDRTCFDERLLNAARCAGAEIKTNVSVTGCDPEAGAVALDTGEIVHARHIIGADGANSLIRRSFPSFDAPHFRSNMAPALEIHLDPADFPRDIDRPELVIGFLDMGYGWIFPHKDKVVVGICGLRKNNENFGSLFSDYLTSLGVDPTKALPYQGHPLPYGNYLDTPVFGRTLLAGDAAGLVEPLLGEGIFYALCSGYYAAQSVAESIENQTAPGPRYLRRIHTTILPELRASNRFRWTLFSAMRLMGPRSVKLLLAKAGTPLGEMVNGMRSYGWLRKKEWDFIQD